MDDEIQDDPLTESVIGAAIEVHRQLGPGVLESAYEECLAIELTQRGFTVERQVILPLTYKGHVIEEAYRIDMIVNSKLVLELKAVDKILPVHETQLTSYLRLSGHTLGLLINFHAPVLYKDIRRRVNKYVPPPSALNPS